MSGSRIKKPRSPQGPKGRNIPAQGKEQRDAVLGQAAPQKMSHEGAGELPVGWIKCATFHVATLIRGVSYSKEDARKTEAAGFLPILRANNIDGVINYDDLTFVRANLISSEQLLRSGDILFAMSSGSRNLVGKSARITQDVKAGFGAFCGVLRPSAGVSNEFLAWTYQTREFRNAISKVSKGSNINNLKREHLLDYEIPLPPLTEQKRIVAKIEELFSELDAGEASLRRARRQLGVYRQSLLKQAFEGKLTAQWREEHPELLESPDQLLARIQAERQARYEQQVREWEADGKIGQKPRKPKVTPQLTEDEYATLPKLPAEWFWEKNERYLFEVKDGTHDTPQYVESGIPFITQKHIQDGMVVFSDFKCISLDDHKRFSERSNVETGDLLISMIGRPGNCAIVRTNRPFSIKNVGLFKFFESLQSNQFLFYFYQSEGGLSYIMRFAKGGLQPFLGLTELRFWPVPVCSLPEQQEIVRILDEQFEAIGRNEREIDAALKRSEALRQSILKKAFSGRLVPQDPADEPASVLLERIREGRGDVAPGGRETAVKTLAPHRRAVPKLSP